MTDRPPLGPSPSPFFFNQPPRSQAEKDAETVYSGGVTVYANRFQIQTYPNGNTRLVFQEQYSADLSIPPAYRTAVFMAREEVMALHQLLGNVLYPQRPPLKPPGT